MEQGMQLNEVIVAIERFSTRVDGRFDIIDGRFSAIDDRFSLVETRCTDIHRQTESIRREVVTMRGSMITRDYLDERLLSVRNDFSLLVRREDGKLNTLVDVLHLRNVISDSDRSQLLTMGPFPQD